MTDDAKTRRYQPRKKTVERYGTCDLTISRWERDPNLHFPPPLLINGKKYDDIDLLDEWDRQRIRLSIEARNTQRKARAERVETAG